MTMLEKFKIRKRLLSFRDEFDNSKYQDKDNLIFEKILKLVNNHKSLKAAENILGLYFSLKTEPDLFKLALMSGMKVALPKTENAQMNYVSYMPGGSLVKSNFGDLYEPAGNIVINPNISIVPGVAFDQRGFRLGYGVGHYDRYFALKANKDIIKIGTCYDEMLFSLLPAEPHDIKMDYIVTETNIYKF